jgi:hypothetical protein
MATDPKVATPAPAAAPDTTLTAILAQMATLMAKQGEREDVEDLSSAEARKAGRRLGATGAYENAFAPEISAYNPRGERDFPRSELACKMIYVGFKLAKEALTVEEIELLNQMKPGDYRVTKSDGKSIPFVVTAKLDAAGRRELLTFHFPCKSTEDRHNHMPMAAYLREALAQQAA